MQLEEQVLLERVLERLHLGDAEWKSTLFEQKRSIAGLKTHLSWHWAPRKLQVSLKLSFSSNFFNQLMQMHEGDLIIELS